MKRLVSRFIPSLTAIAATTGAIITASALYIAFDRVVQHRKDLFDAEADRIHEEVSRRVSAAEEAVYGLNVVFSATTSVDAEQFNLLAGELRQRHDFIRRLFHFPLVSGGERNAFETQMQDSGYVTFTIRDRSGSRFRPADTRDRYFPLLYIEPQDPVDAAWLGFDILSADGAERVVGQAIDTAGAALLLPGPFTSTDSGYVLLMSTYAGMTTPATLAKRRGIVNGLVGLEVDANRLLAGIEMGGDLSISLRLVSDDGKVKPAELAEAGGVVHDHGGPVLIRFESIRNLHGSNHEMEVRAAMPLHLDDIDARPLLLAVAAGMFVSIILILLAKNYVAREQELRRRNDEIQEKVDERTRELKLTVGQLYSTTSALEKKREEQQVLIHKLQNMQAQLLQSEKMAAVGMLAAGVAHEINNPVAAVQSNLGSLQGYCSDLMCLVDAYEWGRPTDAREPGESLENLKQTIDLPYLKDDLFNLISESKEGLKRVCGIVSSLQSFAREGESEWQIANLHSGLDRTLEILLDELNARADVVKEYGDLPDVECMASQISQVFMNILVNAAHAMEKRGTITIRTGTRDDQVWIEIADTGKGIEPEQAGRIFDPFFTTKPVGSGMGLGLAVAYNIIKKHGGRIEVESQLGQGSTFRVWLPVKQDKTETGGG